MNPEAVACRVFLEELQVDHTVIRHKANVLAVISTLGDVVRPSRNDYSDKSRHGAMEQKGTDPSEARNERRRVCALSCGRNDITLLYSIVKNHVLCTWSET